MTNEEMLQDLKQFIRASVHQEVSSVHQEFTLLHQEVAEFKEEITREVRTVDEKLDNITQAIAETFTSSLEPIESIQRDHERRIGRLEQRAA